MISGNLFNKVTFFLFLSLALLTCSARAASSLTLYIPNIPGDGITNSITVYSFSLGVSTPPPPIGGGGASKPDFSDLNLMKALDSASSPLMFNSAMGTTLNNVVLTYINEFGKPAYSITLNNVTVTSVQVSGSDGGGTPTESISLHFQSIQWSYQKYTVTGQPVGSPITHTWNLATNTGT
jgi:type VI secretion system Hcp family effector